MRKDPFSRNLTRTLFSFDSAGKKYLSVSVEGEPKLASGQTITVAMRKAGNWQTVRGMLVHETGELCVRGTALYLWSMLLTAFIAAIVFMQLRFDHPQLIMPFMMTFGLVAGALAYGAYSARQLGNLLLKQRSTTSA